MVGEPGFAFTGGPTPPWSRKTLPGVPDDSDDESMRQGGEELTVGVNEYFVAYPEQCLGEWSTTTRLYAVVPPVTTPSVSQMAPVVECGTFMNLAWLSVLACRDSLVSKSRVPC